MCRLSGLELRQRRRHLVLRIYHPRPRHQIETGKYQPALPDDRFTGLVQLALEAVGIGTLGDPGHLPVGGDLGDRVGAEIRGEGGERGSDAAPAMERMPSSIRIRQYELELPKLKSRLHSRAVR